MKHGAIRNWLETLKAVAQMSGLSLEQIADVFDANAKLAGLAPTSSTDDTPPLAEGPKGVQ